MNRKIVLIGTGGIPNCEFEKFLSTKLASGAHDVHASCEGFYSDYFTSYFRFVKQFFNFLLAHVHSRFKAAGTLHSISYRSPSMKKLFTHDLWIQTQLSWLLKVMMGMESLKTVKICLKGFR